MTLGMAGIILCYPVAYWSFIMAYLVAVGSTIKRDQKVAAAAGCFMWTECAA
ncbi:hypothetical protein, unlikely [Trypanosoma brucei brucei TREU927]|uniref:Uncharacterized protein n=2 Tax=Trypanosoma brucei TaxID=5691 RepID=Q38FF9_TRYB2|nr:hypothetical protein, unlikely [Trypanosoma brucei brucei TREU927]EAN76461.1 hypothetical protein, unlikely [Trypanosoma brucei brucei TREU927]RHW70367.1 hypothetical protein DPX39_090014200 [Trypanosoma brucei equiperdum]